MNKNIFLTAAAIGTLALASCSDADPTPDVTAAYIPSGIEMVIPDNLQQLIYTDNTGAQVLPLVKGEKATLGYTVSPDTIGEKAVAWTSSVPAVATVSDGIVEAISSTGLGYSIITVTPVGMYSGSGVSSTLKVKVDDQLVPASDISLTGSATEVYEGETVQLQAEIMPENATYRTVKWASADESVASVDSKGVVTGVKVKSGTQTPVTITATSLDGSNVVASYDLTVKRIVQPESVTLDEAFAASNYQCAIAEKSVTLSYTTYPEDCTSSLIEWSSSDESIATVKDGVVTFNQNGNFGDFTITASCPATGQSSSIQMSLPAGLIRELFHNENNLTWNSTTNGTWTWHDGYLSITTPSSGYKRQDFKSTQAKTWICPANYPIFAVKVDDVKDQAGVTGRNITFDTSGKDLNTGTSYSGGVNGNNNKWLHDYKCSDGSHVFIYDFTKQSFAKGGLFPANDIGQFTTFQFKYADIKVNGKDATSPITYNLYWVQTFKTLDDIEAYLKSEGLTFEQIK